MIKSKKQSLIVIGVFTLALLLGSVTYAFFNYTRTGNPNNFSVGRINFISRQTETISLTNLFPIDPTETGIMDDDTKVGTLEIEIEGDTDYSSGIEYLVSATNANIYTNAGQIVPINLDFTVTGLGTASPNYFTAREDKNATIYKKLVGDTLVGDQMLLVGYVKPNTTSGVIEGVDGTITITAYLDKNKILISDTYDGTESDNMGTPNSMAEGKTVISTTDWNSLSTNGLSFKVRVEANEGIWVNESLEMIMKRVAVMDNINSEFVNNYTPGIDFGDVSGDTNGKGVYMRSGTENDAYPIVYYRGAVEDNNVVFNNICWKAVRTTDTGGVKLIYNGENTGTIDEPNCNNTGTDTHINLSGTNFFAFNTSYNSPAYVGYMYGTVYPSSYSNWTSGVKFGSSFTWDGTNYKLTDATVTNPDATHHYSCNSADADATCTDLRYVFYTYNNNATKYYITLTGGDGVEQALTKMNTNTNNSNAKTLIDTWYANNMNTITNKLEDTVWCNDRSIGKYNGWSATGSWGTDWEDNSLLYGAFERSNYATNTSTVKNEPSLACANKNDSFTVSTANGNGALTYPVALLTEDEMVLAGGLAGSQSQFYLNNGSTYHWSLSPSYFDNVYANEFYVYDGYVYNYYVYSTRGLRPSVSLKPGTPVVSGTGTVLDPYVIG